MKELKANLAKVKNIYNTCSSNVKKVLEDIFGKEPFEFNYRDIKSFEDACDRLGISHYLPYVPNEYRAGFIVDEQAADQSAAMYKLMVICKAMCNGKYTDKDGNRWLPYYWIYGEQEMEGLNEEEIKSMGIRPVSASDTSGRGIAGICLKPAYYKGVYTTMDFGFNLYANSKEMAEYLDEQFRDLIYQCYGIKIKEENE